MALLIYSTKCTHSVDIVNYIRGTPELSHIVKLHDVNVQGIPEQYRGKITRVPTLLTQNGKMLVGSEVKQWLMSIIPQKELETCDIMGRCGMSSIDGNDDSDNLFSLDHYGQSLQPAMTQDLQNKISRSVTDTYTNTIKK
jgi:hypothetical protein